MMMMMKLFMLLMLMCSLFVPKDEDEETLLLLLISESIVRHFFMFCQSDAWWKINLALKSDLISDILRIISQLVCAKCFAGAFTSLKR